MEQPDIHRRHPRKKTGDHRGKSLNHGHRGQQQLNPAALYEVAIQIEGGVKTASQSVGPLDRCEVMAKQQPMRRLPGEALLFYYFSLLMTCFLHLPRYGFRLFVLSTHPNSIITVGGS